MPEMTARPVALPVSPQTIPDELKALRQWVAWAYEYQPQRSQAKPWTKVPKNPAIGGNASPTDPQTWAAFVQAVVVLNGHEEVDGIGFVLTTADPYVALDLDGCRDVETGEIQSWAQAIVDRVRSYSEISPSATGLRILLKGQLPPHGRKKGAIEVYETARYVTITGAHLRDTPTTIEPRQAELDAWHREVFGEPKAPGDPSTNGNGPVSPLSDEVILQKALGARNAAKFARLWAGEITGYPSASEADLALCTIIAFWTRDVGQIDQLFRQSKLMRDKWDEEHGETTYGELTIQRALEKQTVRWTRSEAGKDHNSQDGYGEAPSDEESKPPRKSQATLLVEIAADAELWHTPEGEPYATIPIDGHRETWPINAKGFRRWLKRLYYLKMHSTPSSQAIQDAIGVLEGKAQYDGSAYPINTRLAEHHGKLYLDLANERWEAIEIDPQGWRLVSEPPVKFRRTRGMLPLPCPVPGGGIEDLRLLLNVGDTSAWTLVKAWLAQALRPTGPYPTLVLHGEQGSAKSTTSRMLRGLVDPNTAPLRAEPREGRDLMIAATNGWCIALDNLSHLPAWLSDAICRLSTGGGFSTRELFSDGEEMIFSAQRPVLLNGIEELATRGDLLDRCIIIYLPSIPEYERRPEADLWHDFEAKRPAILGALLDAVSEALRRFDTVKLPRLPRMADFALWASAAAPKLGYTPEIFLEAYAGSRQAANELTLEASILTPHLKDLVDGGFSGTSTELLERLNNQASDETKRQKAWAKNGRALSNALRRIAPNLRAVGVDVTFTREGKRGTRTITLSSEQTRESSSASSASSAYEENQQVVADAMVDAKSPADAKSPPADASRTQTQSSASHWKIRQTDVDDAADAKNSICSHDDEEVIDL